MRRTTPTASGWCGWWRSRLLSEGLVASADNSEAHEQGGFREQGGSR